MRRTGGTWKDGRTHTRVSREDMLAVKHGETETAEIGEGGEVSGVPPVCKQQLTLSINEAKEMAAHGECCHRHAQSQLAPARP